VRDAEESTGLQMTVYLGPAEDDPRAQAERLLAAGGSARPAVLLLVAPTAHRVEIVTAPAARDRVPDEACAHAVEVMVGYFRRGEFDAGIIAGVEELARVAGPGRRAPTDIDLPDVLGDEDEAP
jgi:uncharacterized membrane protein YgcG